MLNKLLSLYLQSLVTTTICSWDRFTGLANVPLRRKINSQAKHKPICMDILNWYHDDSYFNLLFILFIFRQW